MNYREMMSRLNAALNNIDSAYSMIAKKYGLTFNALMMVCIIDESSGATQKQICDELHLPKSTVHSILQDFVKNDYVSLEAGNNKKEKRVALSSIGRKHFSKVLEETQCFEDKVLATLGDSTCAVLVETAESLSEIIKKEIAAISRKEVLV